MRNDAKRLQKKVDSCIYVILYGIFSSFRVVAASAYAPRVVSGQTSLTGFIRSPLLTLFGSGFARLGSLLYKEVRDFVANHPHCPHLNIQHWTFNIQYFLRVFPVLHFPGTKASGMRMGTGFVGAVDDAKDGTKGRARAIATAC